ncbi:MAG TPA: sugar ABC transporter substrate-binding protein [Candidatus Atribacteria bacterium]|nr:sugar ABC transporter substrate-binding protein [Candidatus Atribacteria bacterium]
MKSNLKVGLLIFIVIFLFSSIFLSSFAAEKEYTIYVVVHGGIADPFWKVCEKGALDAGALYPDLKVVYTGPTVFKLEEFMSYIESALASKPDALVCTLTAPDAMDESLRAAIAQGLPVVAINAPDLRTPEDARIPVLTYVGEDSYFIGVSAARETLKRFTPKRAIFCNHHPGATHIEARGRGYIDTLKAKGVIAEALDITEDAVKGAEMTAAYLKAHPDTDAIFCSNTLRTETIIPRLEADGIKVGVDVKIAQMDCSPKILEYIQEGKVMFTMDQQQYLQGYLGVVFAYLNAKYGYIPPPAPVSTGPAVITADDIPSLEELVKEGYR